MNEIADPSRTLPGPILSAWLECLAMPFENLTKLSNGGEMVELSMPGDTDLQGVRYYITVDSVLYDDESPWPAGPDGSWPIGEVQAWPIQASTASPSLYRG